MIGRSLEVVVHVSVVVVEVVVMQWMGKWTWDCDCSWTSAMIEVVVEANSASVDIVVG
jgi:hypothetical protein